MICPNQVGASGLRRETNKPRLVWKKPGLVWEKSGLVHFQRPHAWGLSITPWTFFGGSTDNDDVLLYKKSQTTNFVSNTNQSHNCL